MSRIRAFASHGPDSEAAPTDDEIQDASLMLMDDVVQKHMGPGPHPSGSDQSVHGENPADLVPLMERDLVSVAPWLRQKGSEEDYARLKGMDLDEYREWKTSYDELVESIDREGIKEPIDVGPDMVMDGHHRIAAALQLGMEVVPVRRRVAKHMGPGPHPSGSPQSVHSGRGTRAGPPSADIDEAPEVFYDGQQTSIMIGGARTKAHDAIVKRSVDAFEEAYPGFLPETVEFYFTTQKNGGAGAWVAHATPDIVYVNIDYWEDLPHIASTWKGTELAVRKGTTDIDTIREGVLFHELAHVGAFTNWGFYHPGDLPYYTKTWYPQNVKSDDPSLPSMYATSSQTEYLAEALTDAAYNGDKAAPLSQRSARWLRKVWLPNRDRLATLTEGVGSAAVTKHAGPGAHPSGSPQSVHAGGSVWQSPDAKGKKGPDLGEETTTPLLWGTKDEGILFEGRRNEYDQNIVIKAVTEFRETFPGVLPPVPRIVFLDQQDVDLDHSDVPDGAEAWVNPYDTPGTVFVRKTAWDTDTDLSQYKDVEGVAFRKAKQFGGRKAQDAYKEAIVFHELAHVGMAIQGWEGAPGLPHYSPEWYAEQVPGKDPSLPSMYAATHPAEYFAEALSDYHLRKQNAAPLSIVTVEKVQELLEYGRDDDWHYEEGGMREGMDE